MIPEWSLPLTPTTIVSTAIATRDWQDVHHDRDVAQAAGSKDIFMNILTTNGLVERYVVDWAGHDAELKGIAIRLGAPAHPYDTLTFSGTVTSVEDGIATIDVVGRVSLGDHVTGTVQGGRPRDASRARPPSPASARPSSPRQSGRSELQLSVEAVRAALADCGLSAADVDGLTTFTMDTSSEIAVARELGVPELRFFSRINFGGGGACATVQQAAMAVATGVADVVVCYRGFNERSERRFGQFSLRRRQPGQHQRPRQRLDLPDGARHAGRDGRDAGPALHARLRRHLRGLRRASRSPTAGTRPPTRTRSSTGSRSRSRTTRPRG